MRHDGGTLAAARRWKAQTGFRRLGGGGGTRRERKGGRPGGGGSHAGSERGWASPKWAGGPTTTRLQPSRAANINNSARRVNQRPNPRSPSPSLPLPRRAVRSAASCSAIATRSEAATRSRRALLAPTPRPRSLPPCDDDDRAFLCSRPPATSSDLRHRRSPGGLLSVQHPDCPRRGHRLRPSPPPPPPPPPHRKESIPSSSRSSPSRPPPSTFAAAAAATLGGVDSFQFQAAQTDSFCCSTAERDPSMARRHFLLLFSILLCIPILSGAYCFFGGVPEAARALEAHDRFNQLATQMDMERAAGAGSGEMDHGAGAGTDAGFGILRWTVGGIFIAYWVALFVGLIGSEPETLPAVRPVMSSPEITHPVLSLVLLLVCISVVYIFLNAVLRQ